MYVLLLLVSLLFFILGIYYFFCIFFTQTNERYTSDDRVDLMIWEKFIPMWVKVWMTCFTISGLAFIWAAKLHNLGM